MTPRVLLSLKDGPFVLTRQTHCETLNQYGSVTQERLESTFEAGLLAILAICQLLNNELFLSDSPQSPENRR